MKAKRYVKEDELANLMTLPDFIPLLPLEVCITCPYCGEENTSIFIEVSCEKCGGPLAEGDQLVGMVVGGEEVWLRASRDSL